jgi:putative DNA primase/helicase
VATPRRPLFGLADLAAAPGASVILGPSKALRDRARIALPSVVHVAAGPDFDLEPLRGRKVVALTPELARAAAAAGATVRLLDGDLDDALQRGIADASWIRAHLAEVPAGPAPTPAPVPEPASRAEPAPRPDAGAPFRCLGYDGDRMFYFTRRSMQVRSIQAAKHSDLNLMTLAPMEYWALNYPGPPSRGGADWRMAANALIQGCYAEGVYDPGRVRGRGAWWDDGRAVIHLGDRLVVDGQERDLFGQFVADGEFIYQASRRLRGPQGEPLGPAEAGQVLDVARMFRWERPIYAYLCAGWIVVAPVCGALNWRPHLWITGGAGSGKTTLLRDFVKALLAGVAYHLKGKSSEAGIRRLLRADALSILFDESEANGEKAAARIAEILGLMRATSSEDGAVTAMAGAGDDADIYSIRSCFMLASIRVALQEAADEQRVTVLGLRSPPKDTIEQRRANEQHYARLLKALAEFTPEFSGRLLARTIGLLPTIRANAEVFKVAVARHLGTARAGDQLGTLLAGAYALRSGRVLTEEEAVAWVAHPDREWGEIQDTTETSDALAALQAILQARARDPSKPAAEVTIGELVAACVHAPGEDEFASADRMLRRYGLKVEGDRLFVANQHSALERIMAPTSWPNGWGRLLKGVEGAEPTPSATHFSPGAKSRAMMLPIKAVLG